MTPARPSRWAESKLQQHNHGVQWACTVGAQTHAWGSSKDKGWGQQGSEAACELSINGGGSPACWNGMANSRSSSQSVLAA